MPYLSRLCARTQTSSRHCPQAMCITPPSHCPTRMPTTHHCPISSFPFDGLNNQDATKDDDYEADTDQVQIGIEIAAETRPQLGELARSVRKTLREYFREHQGDDSDEDYQLIPEDMTLTAQPVQYDSLKPCYWQQLQYQCDTTPDDNEQD